MSTLGQGRGQENKGDEEFFMQITKEEIKTIMMSFFANNKGRDKNNNDGAKKL
jgi:hypothetical protein